jgi:ATP-dependent helicase/DNAse subunit B
MTASLHLLCGPAGTGKTNRLLQRYREVARSGIGTALWLGPTRRSVEALRGRLLGELPGLLAPQLFTFQDFAEEIIRVNDPTARPLSDLQRRLLVDDLVAELHAGRQLSHFDRIIDTRGFAEAVFALLAELKRNEIWPTEFARAAYLRGYRGRHVFRTRRGRTISVKDRQCARLYARYQQRLVRHHLFDLEGRLWYARDLLTRGHRQPFEAVRAVFMDGFTDFTRTQYEILEALNGWVDEVWIALLDESGDDRIELFTRPRATRERLTRLASGGSELQAGPQETDLGEPPPLALPAGLAHIERQLFRPVREVRLSVNADGLLLLAAPGMLGEARMVAREVKLLLLDGVRADDILVTMRDIEPYADLVREVFDEYGIPHDVEGADPLQRNPAVATLLRCVRLREEDWPFAGVTALLRSGYFRPAWPEAASNMPQHAEALLRLLGQPRGREAYLRAVESWAERPEPGLEDEQAEESRRQRTHALARKCRPFLQRFFAVWDAAPQKGTLAEHLAWLHRFAEDLGLVQVAAEDRHDRAALDRFWDELERWSRLEASFPTGPRVRDRAQLFRLLDMVAAGAGLARSPRGPGRVRVLSAELARHLETPHVFLMGLGERSFPNLTADAPLFDEAERRAFKQAGLDLPGISDRLPDEMLLFYQVVTRARRRLVLSYPALDDRGQSLLPSSFLNTLLDCFEPAAIERITKQKRMLIEGYDRDPPLCPAELRVQAARANAACGSLTADSFFNSQSAIRDPHSADLAAHLVAAARVVQGRFRDRDFGPYDGLLRHPAALAELGERCGPGKVFSPTALETYIACPFRFLLQHVLHLEPLEDPKEEIEHTRRGSVFHRALARLHQQLSADGVNRPTEEVSKRLLQKLEEAVGEYIVRAPSPASKELWRLEGERLQRAAARYGSQWQQFVEPWLEHKLVPCPFRFEVDFGCSAADGQALGPLTIRVDGIEVQIGGRIDRIDVAELPDGVGFWIIDYKTGSGRNYTPADLLSFQKLQLTLYALAVEQVILGAQPARPLGLAYWMVTDTGAKLALPNSRRPTAWFEKVQDWQTIRNQLATWVATLVRHIRAGAFPLQPREENCTATCDYSQVCRISQSRPYVEKKSWRLPLPTIN